MNTDGLLLEGLGEKENYFQARVSIDCEQSLFFFFRDTVECEHEHSTKQNMASQRSNRHSLTEEIQEKPAKISRSLYSLVRTENTFQVGELLLETVLSKRTWPLKQE